MTGQQNFRLVNAFNASFGCAATIDSSTKLAVSTLVAESEEGGLGLGNRLPKGFWGRFLLDNVLWGMTKKRLRTKPFRIRSKTVGSPQIFFCALRVEVGQ